MGFFPITVTVWGDRLLRAWAVISGKESYLLKNIGESFRLATALASMQTARLSSVTRMALLDVGFCSRKASWSFTAVPKCVSPLMVRTDKSAASTSIGDMNKSKTFFSDSELPKCPPSMR